MANRTFQEKQLSLLKNLVHLYPVVSVGAAGAVTLKKRKWYQPGAIGVGGSYTLVDAPTSGVGYDVGDGAGTRTVSRSDTGDWTITLSDPYTYLVGVRIAMQSLAAPGALVVLAVATISSSNVATNTALGNGGVINITLNDESGAADPADGTVVTLHLVLGNASEP